MDVGTLFFATSHHACTPVTMTITKRYLSRSLPVVASRRVFAWQKMQRAPASLGARNSKSSDRNTSVSSAPWPDVIIRIGYVLGPYAVHSAGIVIGASLV